MHSASEVCGPDKKEKNGEQSRQKESGAETEEPIDIK